MEPRGADITHRNVRCAAPRTLSSLMIISRLAGCIYRHSHLPPVNTCSRMFTTYRNKLHLRKYLSTPLVSPVWGWPGWSALWFQTLTRQTSGILTWMETCIGHISCHGFLSLLLVVRGWGDHSVIQDLMGSFYKELGDRKTRQGSEVNLEGTRLDVTFTNHSGVKTAKRIWGS